MDKETKIGFIFWTCLLSLLTGLFAYAGYQELPQNCFDEDDRRVTGLSRMFCAKTMEVPEYFRDQGMFTNSEGEEYVYSYSLVIPNVLKTKINGNYGETYSQLAGSSDKIKKDFINLLSKKSETLEKNMGLLSMMVRLQSTLNTLDLWELPYTIQYEENPEKNRVGPLPITPHLYAMPDNQGLESIGKTWLWFWKIDELENGAKELAKFEAAFWQNEINVNGNRWIYTILTTGRGVENPEQHAKKQEELEEILAKQIQEEPDYCEKSKRKIQKEVNLPFNYMLQPENLQFFVWFQI